jgi:hypothetical protein
MGYVLDREREDADGINNEAAGVTIIETRGTTCYSGELWLRPCLGFPEGDPVRLCLNL